MGTEYNLPHLGASHLKNFPISKTALVLYRVMGVESTIKHRLHSNLYKSMVILNYFWLIICCIFNHDSNSLIYYDSQFDTFMGISLWACISLWFLCFSYIFWFLRLSVLFHSGYLFFSCFVMCWGRTWGKMSLWKQKESGKTKEGGIRIYCVKNQFSNICNSMLIDSISIHL